LFLVVYHPQTTIVLPSFVAFYNQWQAHRFLLKDKATQRFLVFFGDAAYFWMDKALKRHLKIGGYRMIEATGGH